MFALNTRPLFGRKYIVIAQVEGYRGAHGPVIFDKVSGRELIHRGCDDSHFYTQADRDTLLAALEASGLKEDFAAFKALVWAQPHVDGSNICEVQRKDGGFQVKAWGVDLHQNRGVFTDLHLVWNQLAYWLMVHNMYSNQSAYAAFRHLLKIGCPPASIEELSDELMRSGGYYFSIVVADNIRW